MKKQNKKQNKKQEKGIIGTTGKGKERIFSECRQKECAHYQMGGCQKCQECGAEPKMVDEGCKTCFDCEFKPGCVRWGDKTQDNTNQEAELNEFKKAILETILNIKQKEQQKILLGNGGELLTANSDDKKMEEEFKKELMKQMVTQMMNKAIEEKDIKENKEEPVKKKEVTYIG